MSVFQVQAKDAIYRINDAPTINAMQNFSWDPAFNEEFLEELGNPAYAATSVEPEISGSFDVNATGGAVALLKKMIQDIDVNGEFTGYLWENTTQNNAGTIVGEDLEFAVFDLIGPKQTNEAWERSEFFPRLFLSSVSFSADASGNATDTYNFEGQLAHVYRTPHHDMVSKAAVYTSATSFTLVDTAFRVDTVAGEASVGGTPTHTVTAIMINENVYDDTVISDIDDSVGAGPCVFTLTGVTVPVGARIMVWAYADTPSTFPTVVNPVTAEFVRGNSIDIWLVDVGTVDISGIAEGSLNAQSFADADQFLRVQTIDINADLRREALRQIKKQTGSSIYYRGATYPLQINISASTFESDLDDWRRITGAAATSTDAYDDKLDLAAFENQTYQVVVRYYYNDQVLQTVCVLDAFVTGMGYSTSTGGRGEVSWSFVGSDLRIEGSDV